MLPHIIYKHQTSTVATMLFRILTALVTTMLYCSTSMPSWSPLPQRTYTAPSVGPVSLWPLRRTYLARGLTGRVHCPAVDDPPHRLVIWSRSGRVIQSSDDMDDAASSRLRVDVGGILVVEVVQPSDAGDYRCTLYSPQDDAGRQSFVIRVIVKGK